MTRSCGRIKRLRAKSGKSSGYKPCEWGEVDFSNCHVTSR